VYISSTFLFILLEDGSALYLPLAVLQRSPQEDWVAFLEDVRARYRSMQRWFFFITIS